MEAVNDVLLGDVGMCVEEVACVRSQELIIFLLALSQIITSTCSIDRTLEVVDEDSFQTVPGVDGVFREAFQPCEWGVYQGHQKVDEFGCVGATCDFYGRGVAP